MTPRCFQKKCGWSSDGGISSDEESNNGDIEGDFLVMTVLIFLRMTQEFGVSVSDCSSYSNACYKSQQ